jgi:hypothetical protein
MFAGADEQRLREALMVYINGNSIMSDIEFDELKLLKVPWALLP